MSPAFIGDTILPEHEVVALERKSTSGLVTLRVTLTWAANQGMTAPLI